MPKYKCCEIDSTELVLSQVFKVPQYEKDQNFSGEFIRALKEFFRARTWDLRYYFVLVSGEDEYTLLTVRRCEFIMGDIFLRVTDGNGVESSISLKNVDSIGFYDVDDIDNHLPCLLMLKRTLQ